MRHSTPVFGLFFVFTIAFACKKEATSLGEFAFLNDFEGQFGYNPNVMRGKTSHSGNAYFKLNADMEFSPAFIQQFKTIANKRFAKAVFTAYVLMPDPYTTAAMAIQVWAPDNTPIKVEQKNLSAKEMGTNRWNKISFELPLDGLDGPDNQLRCFIHNPARQTFYVDDFTVEILPMEK